MSRKYLLDLLERTGSTFVQAAAGIIIASGGFGLIVWKAALIAGGLAVAKGVAAKKVGSKDTASVVTET